MKFEPGKVYSNPYARAFKSQQMMEDERDHEVGMAQGQLDYIIKSATELKGKLGSEETNVPGWIQDHISKAHSYLHQANSGYHKLGDKESVNESKISPTQLKSVYDKLSKGDTLEVTYDSSISKNITKTFKVVKGRTVVGKNNVERITLVNVDKPTAVKYYLYNRGGNISFAIGDMGASITGVKQDVVNESYRIVAKTKQGETFKSKVFKTREDALSYYYRMVKSDNKYRSIDVVKEYINPKPIKLINILKK